MSKIVKIIMKPGISRSKFQELTSWLDYHGKLISNAEQTEDGHFVAIACFDSRVDYLAFLVATGFCRTTASTREIE